MTKEKIGKYLAAGIERWMEAGEPVLTLEYMLAFVEGDISVLQEYLFKWQSENRIEWLKPLDPSNPKAEVVRFKTYINKDVSWR